MWTEVLAVLIIALANVVCYITHEKSLLHGHLNLPKVLFISNRCLSPDVSSSCTSCVISAESIYAFI